MAKKKQVNEATPIAEAIKWLEKALKDDSVVNLNDFLSIPLEKLKEELVGELVKKTLESAKQEKSKGKGGKKERISTRDLPADPVTATIEAQTRF